MLTIQPFSPNYQDPAHRLILSGLEEHWGWIDENLNPDLKNIAASYASGHFVIGLIGNSLAATGALIPEDNESKRIVRMSVALPHRRKGFGKQILNHLVNLARQMQTGKIVLETTETWYDVISFYRAYGFKVQHHQDGNVHMSMEVF